MTGIGIWLREIGYGVAFLGSAILGVLLALNVAGQMEIDPLSPIVRGLLGIVALSTAVYFLVQVAETARSRTPIETTGSGGSISISPEAVRSLVHEILRDTFAIDDARVRIRSAGEGLRVAVRFSLPPDRKIPEISERIQTDVRGRIEDRIGVTVDRVDVTAQAFKAESPQALPERSEPTDQHTDLPEERDRVD
ncbi:MAG: alkaline shock response membrane anchor protein AmaP [Candidatus Bipolaricaulia bacterium]